MSSTSVLPLTPRPAQTSVLSSNPLSASEADVFAPEKHFENPLRPLSLNIISTSFNGGAGASKNSSPSAIPLPNTSKKTHNASETFSTRAFVMYHRERVEVVVESTFTGSRNRLMANVKAVSGYPFNGTDVEAQGDFSGGAFPNSNGLRVPANFVIVEPSPTLTDETQSIYMQHPLTEAEQIEAEVRSYSAWLMPEDENDWTDPYGGRAYISGGEVLEVEPYRPASNNDDMPF